MHIHVASPGQLRHQCTRRLDFLWWLEQVGHRLREQYRQHWLFKRERGHWRGDDGRLFLDELLVDHMSYTRAHLPATSSAFTSASTFTAFTSFSAAKSTATFATASTAARTTHRLRAADTA